MYRQRKSGILLHPTSLPGPGGIGSFGRHARGFVEFLRKSRQSLWQVLPLGPTATENSPYSCYSAFAGNPLLIDLETLAEEGDLSREDLQSGPVPEPGGVDYGATAAYKFSLLKKAASRFFAAATPGRKEQFTQFCSSHPWLHDYALFMALRTHLNGEPWSLWPEPLARRDVGALANWAEKLRGGVEEQKYLQWQFFRQWKELKGYANASGISVIGDLPIFVALESSDVWVTPHLFNLDEKNVPLAVAGVPPDYFSKDGQIWGNPLYHWDLMASEGFSWWSARLRHTLSLFDMVRVDHFRGFEAFWEIPVSAGSAINGRWVKGPGAALFHTLLQDLGDLPIIAEDLGVITPEVDALRDRFGFPGMKVLQFAFCSGPKNPYLPHNHVRPCVVYTGTHDNDTTLGWYHSLGPGEQKTVLTYLNQDGNDIVWDMIKAAFASVADYAVIPMQDLLELPCTARMNVPGVDDGNWCWRCATDAFSETLAAKLAGVTEVYGRASPGLPDENRLWGHPLIT